MESDFQVLKERLAECEAELHKKQKDLNLAAELGSSLIVANQELQKAYDTLKTTISTPSKQQKESSNYFYQLEERNREYLEQIAAFEEQEHVYKRQIKSLQTDNAMLQAALSRAHEEVMASQQRIPTRRYSDDLTQVDNLNEDTQIEDLQEQNQTLGQYCAESRKAVDSLQAKLKRVVEENASLRRDIQGMEDLRMEVRRLERQRDEQDAQRLMLVDQLEAQELKIAQLEASVILDAGMQDSQCSVERQSSSGTIYDRNLGLLGLNTGRTLSIDQEIVQSRKSRSLTSTSSTSTEDCTDDHPLASQDKDQVLDMMTSAFMILNRPQSIHQQAMLIKTRPFIDRSEALDTIFSKTVESPTSNHGSMLLRVVFHSWFKMVSKLLKHDPD